MIIPPAVASLLMRILLLLISTLCFFIFLGLWTYYDAQERTDNPKLWTLIVLAVPSFLGLIIYLLVGRDKDGYSSGRFHKAVITFAVCAGLSLVMVVGSAVSLASTSGENLPILAGSLLSMENNLSSSWTRSFRTSNEERSRNLKLNAVEIAAFHVNSSNTDGMMFLHITQESNEILIDISGQFNAGVDLSDFHPGSIKLTLITQQAKNGNIIITWR